MHSKENGKLLKSLKEMSLLYNVTFIVVTFLFLGTYAFFIVQLYTEIYFEFVSFTVPLFALFGLGFVYLMYKRSNTDYLRVIFIVLFLFLLFMTIGVLVTFTIPSLLR